MHDNQAQKMTNMHVLCIYTKPGYPFYISDYHKVWTKRDHIGNEVGNIFDLSFNVGNGSVILHQKLT